MYYSDDEILLSQEETIFTSLVWLYKTLPFLRGRDARDISPKAYRYILHLMRKIYPEGNLPEGLDLSELRQNLMELSFAGFMDEPESIQAKIAAGALGSLLSEIPASNLFN